MLLPAISGSGKSTLTAALLAAGFGYCTDDLALLTGEPVRIRPVPTCLGLKRGSWNILAERLPQITGPSDLSQAGRADYPLPSSASCDASVRNSVILCGAVYCLSGLC